MAIKGMSELERNEYLNLEAALSKVQQALLFGGVEGDALAMLHRFVKNAESKLAQLEFTAAERERLQKEEDQRQAMLRQDMVVSQLVEKESALNSAEKEEYRGLLSHQFFTKAMFGQMEHFYAESWNKLTDGGKEELSHRVWEGVRHGEYKFQELPHNVKEKEATRLNDLLRDSRKCSPELLAIPIEERRAFLDAWANKDCKKAYEIMDHSSFAANVSKSPVQTVNSESKSATSTEVAERITRKEETEAKDASAPSLDSAIGEADLKLDDLKVVNASRGTVAAPLPGNLAGSGTRER